MSDDWRQVDLGALGEFRNGVNFSREQEGSGLPVLKVKDFGEAFFVPSSGLDELDATAVRVPESQYLEPGDVVIIRSNGNPSLVGRCLYFAGSERRITFSGFCIRFRPNPALIESRFAAYVLRSPASRQRFYSFGSGTGIQNLSQSVLASLPVALPTRAEQRAITQLLGALDDKIELNRRMNQTLEAMAQALFRSWFVDVDPVRAKAEGRQPEGMDAETAALFPSRFMDSELGRIPEGWRVAALAETCLSIFSGGTPHTQSAEYWGGGIPWLSSGETRSSFIIGTEKTITTDGVANSSTRLARAGSTVIASAGQGHTRGQTSFLTFDSYINQSVVALVGNPTCSSDLFLFFDLERRYEQFRQISDSHSSRGSLTTKLLGEIKVLVPPLGLVSRYDTIARPLIEQITANLHQSRSLSELRDTLLPKLLSGEIRIRDADAQLAASG